MKTSIGMARRFSRCTPMERPIRNEIRMIQRLAYLLSGASYHLVMAQTTMAVKRELIA